MAQRTEDDFRYEYLDRQVEEAQARRRSKRQQELEKRKAKQKSPQERARIARRRFLFCSGALLCTVLLFFAARTITTLAGLQSQRNSAQEQLDELEKQKSQLENELKEVQSDEYVEQEARSDLRMIFPGEVLYVAPEPENAGSEESVAPQEAAEGGKDAEEDKDSKDNQDAEDAKGAEDDGSKTQNP